MRGGKSSNDTVVLIQRLPAELYGQAKKAKTSFFVTTSKTSTRGYSQKAAIQVAAYTILRGGSSRAIISIMDMQAPIEEVKGIGPKTAEAFRRVNLKTVGDLLYCLPRIYENYQTTVAIEDLKPGKVIIRGRIGDLRIMRTSRRQLTITEGTIRDDTGAVRTVWFNQPYRAKQFDSKREYYFTGKYELKNGRYVLQSPSAQLVQDIEQDGEAAGFQPIYSQKSAIKPQLFQKILTGMRDKFAEIPDLLPFIEQAPKYIRPGARSEALYLSHFPETPEDAEVGRRYLAYEEVFELILAAKLNKLETLRLNAMPLKFNQKLTQTIVKSLPFQLTGAQRKATWEILQELGGKKPMNRMLQGDVGSGKTIVAAIATAQATTNGAQTALLAPTAILANQHFESFLSLFRDLAKKNPGMELPSIALLTGATRGKNQLKKQIREGKVDLVIGTHALLTDSTQFHRLGFCIIDEQHRFGVNQRQKLLLKSPENTAPHLLSMTATPIPRSLQLTVFGDLDVSLLNELPPGRQPIVTKILPELSQADQLYPAMRELLKKKQQIYWICQLIEDKNQNQATPVKRQAKKLAELFQNYRVGMLHGKMPVDEKDQIMDDFADGKIDILVSTTVVEVGVNVPNANMIEIQDSENYGLAQLHQLRGRVGRGDQPAQCFLLTTGENRPSKRLREMEKSTDGFHLAEVDLKIRGPGEIYGAMQHGELNLQVANLSDTAMITAASRHAAEFAKNPKDMVKYPELAMRIRKYQQLTTLN